MDITDLNDISSGFVSHLDALDHSINSIATALELPRYSVRGKDDLYLPMRRDSVYVVHQTEVNNMFILLNRNYKPIGSNLPTAGKNINYSQQGNLIFELQPEMLAKLSKLYNRNNNINDRAYMFGDECAPWSDRKSAQQLLAVLQNLRNLLST